MQVIEHIRKVGQLMSIAGYDRPFYESFILTPRYGKLCSNVKSVATEFETTGSSKLFDDLSRLYPLTITDLLDIPGVGPSLAGKLHKKGITSIADVIQQADAGKIDPKLGEAAKHYLRRKGSRITYGKGIDIYEYLTNKIRNFDSNIQTFVAGSLRRGTETIKDLDILIPVVSEQEKIRIGNFLLTLGKPVLTGNRKTVIRLSREGISIQIDFWLVPFEQLGSYLHYATGSRIHGKALRVAAKRRGWKLNEYGLYNQDRRIAGDSELDIYSKLELPYHIPELREFDPYQCLPVLYKIDGDWDVHTNWSYNKRQQPSIADRVKAASEKGLRFIGISDYEYDLNVDKYVQEIRQAQASTGIKVLAGITCGIDNEGSVKPVKQVDYVIGKVHRHTGRNMTERYIKAVHSGNIDIIGCPTGCLPGEKDYYVDWDAVLKECKKYDVAIQINGSRMDAPTEMVKYAKTMGVKFALCGGVNNKLSDAIRIARRAGLSNENIKGI